MSSNEGLYAPRNLGGVLARIAETPDGGARIEVWTGGNWEPPPPGAVDFAEIMAARPASDAILARINNTGEAPRPKTMFEPGEELLVTDGPFTDFKGVVEEIQYEKSRLTLTINVFNRPTQVELEFRQVEKAN